MNRKGGKELETIGSVITLIGGILEFILPLETLYKLAQSESVGSFPVEETLLAILAVIGCVIIWKGYSIAGGVMSIVTGFLILQSLDFKYRTAAGVLVIIGGMIAIVSRFWRAAETAPEAAKRL